MRPNAKKPTGVKAGFSNHHTSLDGQDEMRYSNKNHVSIATGKSFSWTWRGAEFVRVAPGVYDACCVKWAGPEYVPAYKRYSFRLIFRLIAEDVEVAMFFNFGRNPSKPPGPLSRYFVAWVKTNGDLPRCGEQMSPDVFMEPGLLYTISIADASIDWNKKDKPDCLIYSRAEEILYIRRP